MLNYLNGTTGYRYSNELGYLKQQETFCGIPSAIIFTSNNGIIKGSKHLELVEAAKVYFALSDGKKYQQKYRALAH